MKKPINKKTLIVTIAVGCLTLLSMFVVNLVLNRKSQLNIQNGKYAGDMSSYSTSISNVDSYEKIRLKMSTGNNMSVDVTVDVLNKTWTSNAIYLKDLSGVKESFSGTLSDNNVEVLIDKLSSVSPEYVTVITDKNNSPCVVIDELLVDEVNKSEFEYIVGYFGQDEQSFDEYFK